MIQALFLSILLAGTPYISLKGGVSHLENHELHFEEHTYDKGYGISGAVGYDFGWFRSEVEALHTANKRSTVYNLDQSVKFQGEDTVRKTFFFLNGIFDIPIYERFEGFIGGGYGFPRYQLLGGVRYNFTPRWSGEVGYRFVHEPYDARTYTGPQCAGFDGGICSGPEEVYENHLLMLGVTYNF